MKKRIPEGVIRLSDLEQSWFSQVYEILGENVPFWLVATEEEAAVDRTGWHERLFQRVVDHFRGRILFVQVGGAAHAHPPLEGTLDLRGQTDLRQLVRLVYHSQGVLCPPTTLAHLAATVEVTGGKGRKRPCVVVEGQAPQAVLPGDGQAHNSASVKAEADGWTSLPMVIEAAREVIRRISSCLVHSRQDFLTPRQWRRIKAAIERERAARWAAPPAGSQTMVERAFALACDGGYYPGLHALLNSIAAYHGNAVPVFLYYRDFHPKQLEQLQRHALEVRLFDVACLPFPSPGMWEAKQQILAHCIGRARCVYLLDADLVLVSAVDDVFELARSGRIVSSADGRLVNFDPSYAAYCPRLVGKSQPCINSGALCLDVLQHWDLAGLWSFASQYGAYSVGAGLPLQLPGHGDQGVLNAVAGLLNKPHSYHVLPEGAWCDSTKGCVLKIRHKSRNGGLEVWNMTEQALQRLVHSSGPKWWTEAGAVHLKRFGDKLRCFEHFQALKPRLRTSTRKPTAPRRPIKTIKAKLLLGICSCLPAGTRREAVRATWFQRLPQGAVATFFVGTGPALKEADTAQLTVRDDYASLPQKVQAFFRYALEHYEFEHLFKCDDDTYVCAERLLALAKAGAEYIGGTDWVRQGYASGGAGYLLSRRAVALVAAAPPPGCGAEDVWVGGVLREAGVTLHPTPRLRLDHRELPSPANDLISSHWCSPALMKIIDQGFVAPGATGKPRLRCGPESGSKALV